MIEIVASTLLLTGVALSSAVAVGSPRWRGPAALLALGVCSIIGLSTGVLDASDLVGLPAHTGLGAELMILVGWSLVAAFLPAAGRPRLPRGWPPMVLAMGLGALLGELGAAAVLGAAATSRAAAARLALAAAGGALIGRVGDPAMLVMGPRLGAEAAWLLPVGLLCAMVAWPMRGDLQVDEPNTPAEHPEGCSDPSWAVTGVALLVGVAAQFSPFAVPALLAGSLVLGILGARHLKARARLGVPLHVLAVAGLVLVLAAAGAPALVGHGLEAIRFDYAPQMPALGYLTGVLASLGLDSAGGGLFAAALLDATPTLQDGSLRVALAAGAGVAGIGPLVLAGAVRQGWKMWALQILVAGVVLLLFVL